MFSVQFVNFVTRRSTFQSVTFNFRGLEMDHLTSVLHIYNAGKRGITHSGIMIPESNIGLNVFIDDKAYVVLGYKLLKKKGWTEEQGLGKQGEGHKFPVRTILKRNRTGFGLEKVKAKVTHFRPHDIRAIQHEKLVFFSYFKTFFP